MGLRRDGGGPGWQQRHNARPTKGDAVGVNANVGYMQQPARGVARRFYGSVTDRGSVFSSREMDRPYYHVAAVVILLMAIMTDITAIWRYRAP